MKRKLHGIVVLGLMLAGLFVLAEISGCQKNHPDDKQAVYNALKQNDLPTIEVFQDRHSGEITLRGIVATADQKAHAAMLTQQAAPGYTIKDQIQVQSSGLEGMEKAAEASAANDDVIEDQFKATLTSDRELGHQSIEYSSDKGTLYLKGTVKTEKQKKKAEDLAKKVPQVQHVVNDIAVNPS
jgi:osmotically-inducible protein OsmY